MPIRVTRTAHTVTAGGIEYNVAITERTDEYGTHCTFDVHNAHGVRIGWQAGYRTAEHALSQAKAWLDVATRFGWVG